MFHRPDKVEITRDEYKRIAEHMKDEKFHEMLGEYMLEVSDPKNKDEYDTYLKQLKDEGDLPEGLELIQPTEAFCIRSTLASRKDRNFNQGIYVNICMHDQVDQPKIDGMSWMCPKVPYMVSKIRYDQEEGQTVCNTVDVIFHPTSVMSAMANQQFHKLLCDSALDGCQNLLRERKEDINRDYKVIEGMKCKGGKPALLPVKFAKYDGQKQLTRNKHPGGKAYNEIMDQKDKHNQSKGKGNEESLETVDEEEEPEEKESDVEDFSNGPIAPKYSIVHSYPVEIGQFFNKSNNDVQELQLPDKLVLKIQLPSVDGLENLNCDVKKDKFELSFQEMYYLSLDFGYIVNEDAVKAKFINTKKVLKITLPVVSKKESIINKPVEEVKEPAQEEEENVEEPLAPKEKDMSEIDQSNYKVKFTEMKQVDGQDKVDVDEEELGQEKNEVLDVKEPTENEQKDDSIVLPYQKQEEKPKTVQEAAEFEVIAQEQNPQNEDKVEETVEEELTQVPLAAISPFTDSPVSEDLRIITFHLPKYKKENLYLIHESNHGLIRYKDNTRNCFYAFQSSEQLSFVKSAEITLKKMVDYFSLMIQFKDTSQNGDIWENEVKIRSELGEDEILSLEALIINEIKLLDEEREELVKQIEEEEEKKEAEKAPESEKVEEEAKEKQDEEKEDAAVTANEENKAEDGAVDGENEEENEAVEEDKEAEAAIVDLGIQLVDFDLYDYVTQLD